MTINNISGAETVTKQNSRELVENKNHEEVQQEQKAKVKNGSLKASELNLIQDPIEEKKKKAREEAMDFIKKQFGSDGKVDEVMEECRDQIQSSKDQAKEASQELVEIRKQKEELKEYYKGDEENEDYQSQVEALGAEAAELQKQYDQAHKTIAAATRGIKDIKQENLKRHDMIDATKNAEKSLKASSDEIIGMLKDEAIDKMDQDLDEVVEEAKKNKEEQKKEDEKLEEIRTEREELAEKVQDSVEKEKKRPYIPEGRLETGQDDMLQKHQEILKNAQEIFEQNKLLMDEIKGMVVDSLL